MFANRDVADWLLACDVAEPVIDKTTSAEEIIILYRHHRSSKLRKVTDPDEKSKKLKMLLEVLEEQTELKFSIERQSVDMWFVVERNQEPKSEAEMPFGGYIQEGVFNGSEAIPVDSMPYYFRFDERMRNVLTSVGAQRN